MLPRKWGSVVHIVTRLRSGQQRNLIPDRCKRFLLAFTNRLDWLWGSHSHLFSGYWMSSVRGVKMTTEPSLVQRLGMSGDVPLKVKNVKFTLEQALKAQRRIRGIAVLFL